MNQITGTNQLAADTNNGVYVSEANCEPSEILGDDLFYACLKDLGDDEIIYGLISDEMAEKIRNEYGIL